MQVISSLINLQALLIKDEQMLGMEPAIPCGLIINELVSNALKYAFPGEREGEIRIIMRTFGKGRIELTVSDNGIGISEALDLEVPGTLGLQPVKMLAEDQLLGKVELDRSQGTKFQIRFGV